jgi:hypothetical protein
MLCNKFDNVMFTTDVDFEVEMIVEDVVAPFLVGATDDEIAELQSEIFGE